MVYSAMDVDQSKSLCEEDDDKTGNAAIKKCCADCKTTKTPLWRAGPAGPKSLCNACGIRFRKRKRDMLGLDKNPFKKGKRSNTTTTSTSSSSKSSTITSSISNGNELRKESLKMRLIVMGNTMLFKRSTIVKKQRCQRRRKLLGGAEEEQAAFSLMALSCGSVFA